MKPYAESCTKNQEAILAVLREIFATRQRVLEIASGTGQHAVYFARALPHLIWQPSELPHNLAGIQAWLDEAQLPNVLPPLAIDANAAHWSFAKTVRPELVEGSGDAQNQLVEGSATTASFDAIFNANTVHIISWQAVERLFAHIAQVIAPGGCVCFYGPYNYGGNFTSASNAQFDAWLKSRDPNSGVRDFAAVNQLAEAHGLHLLHDIEMPSNNRILVWQARG